MLHKPQSLCTQPLVFLGMYAAKLGCLHGEVLYRQPEALASVELDISLKGLLLFGLVLVLFEQISFQSCFFSLLL